MVGNGLALAFFKCFEYIISHLMLFHARLEATKVVAKLHL